MSLTLRWYKKYPHDDELKTKNAFFILKKELKECIKSNPDKKIICLYSDNLISLLESMNANTEEYGVFDYYKWSNILHIAKKSNARIGVFIKDVEASEEVFDEYKVILFALAEEFLYFSIKEEPPEKNNSCL